MGIGMSGGNDQGASLEIQFSEARKIGKDVLDTTIRRSEFKIYGDTPSMLLIEADKFSNEFVSGLQKPEVLDEISIEKATESSIGLSIEVALQITGAQNKSSKLVENTDSLEDIRQQIVNCAKYVASIGERDPEIVKKIARLIIERSSQKPEEVDLLEWSKEVIKKAEDRLSRKINLLKELDS